MEHTTKTVVDHPATRLAAAISAARIHVPVTGAKSRPSSQPAKAKRRSVAESAERILACVLGNLGRKALSESMPTPGLVPGLPAVARRKHAMTVILTRPKPRLRTHRNPASLPLRLEPKLMSVSLGLKKRSIPSQKDRASANLLQLTVHH